MSASPRTCAACGEKEITDPEILEIFGPTDGKPWLDKFGHCEACRQKRKRAEELHPYLGKSLDELLNERDPWDAAYNIVKKIEAKKLAEWPHESNWQLTLHEQAFERIYRMKMAIPSTGLCRHFEDGCWFSAISSLKMAGFTRAYSLLYSGNKWTNPGEVEEDVYDAIDLHKLLDFARDNAEMFLTLDQRLENFA